MSVALVTGAAGFIGRHLSRRLSSMGVRVIGVGHGQLTANEQSYWGISHWIRGEASFGTLQSLRDVAPHIDAVYHLAGGSSVGSSLEQPLLDFQKSVVSTAEVLEWTRINSLNARFVLASSAAVYGAMHTGPISEHAHLTPHSPYGFHKLATECLVRSYAHTYGVQAAIVRLFSVYGEGLHKQLLWDSCRKLVADTSQIQLGGSGEEVRDFIHVADATALLAAATRLAGEEPFIVNGGTGYGHTVRTTAETLCAAWGVRTALSFSGVKRKGDPNYLVADTAGQKCLLLPAFTALEVGLRAYVDWFKNEQVVDTCE